MTTVGCQHAKAPSTSTNNPTAGDEVNIGYGTQSEDEVTGAVASLRVEETVSGQEESVPDLIRGRFAGVRVIRDSNGAISLRIRGSDGGEPLVLVDGMPVRSLDFALAGLKARDIARIDVLKDVASTSIYGRRGSNGVILITMKSPR